MKLRLLDLDGSVVTQPGLKALAREGLAQVVNLRPEGRALRLWARRAEMTGFARRLSEEGDPQGAGATVTFIGSGDYHHLTAPLVARLAGPLSIVHFDNHPDWGLWPPANHCGSWVNRVLEMGHVAKVVTIGPCASEVTWPQFKGANIKALASPRLSLYPWRMAPSRILGAVPPALGHRSQKGGIQWSNLASADWDGFVAELVRCLPTDAVYITIDKDVLNADEAVTNWNQGEMRLDHILGCIRTLAASKRIVGVDVCGEYARPEHDHPAKRLLARFNQPRPLQLPDLSPNDRANRRIVDCLMEVGA